MTNQDQPTFLFHDEGEKWKAIDQACSNPEEWLKMKNDMTLKEKIKQSELLKKDFKDQKTPHETMEIGRHNPHWSILFLSTVAFFAATTSLVLTIISMC